MSIKSALIGATAIAIALTSFDLRPAAAAPIGGSAIGAAAKRRDRFQRSAQAADLSHQSGRAARGLRGDRRHDRGVAAANAQREYYERPYYAPRHYGYDDAGRVYGPPSYQYAPPVYHSAPVYQQRGYPQRDYYSRWGGSGGQPGYQVRRKRAGPDQLRQRGRPERPGAAARVKSTAGWQQLISSDSAERRLSGRRFRLWPHILRRKFTC